MMVTDYHEFILALRQGKYTSVGSYPVFFVTEDGGTMSYDFAKSNALEIGRAMISQEEDHMRPVALEVNWEDPMLFCDHSNERIESAYAEDKAPCDVPNFDSMTEQELQEFVESWGEASLEQAQGLLSCPRTDALEIVKALVQYARDTLSARRARVAGDIQIARACELLADTVYERLPEGVKW